MEACEGFHAEEIGPAGMAAYRGLSRTENVVDPASLCAGGGPFDDGAAIAWIEGYDLLWREP